MKIVEPYRGVSYSVDDNDNGKWEWKVYPKIGVSSGPISGELSGTREDAIAAAEAAIDKALAENSN